MNPRRSTLRFVGILALALPSMAARSQESAKKDRSDEIVAAVARASSLRDLESQWESAKALISSMDGQAAKALQNRITTALEENRAVRIKSIAKAKDLPPFRTMAALSKELTTARDEAWKLIFDTSVYLPESAAGWSATDKKGNGQAKVEQKVDALRKIWNQPVHVTFPSSLKEDLRMAQAAGRHIVEFFGADADPLSLFPGFALNLETQALTIRSWVTSREEAEQYAWNRQVERYNDALKHPDVSKEVKDHVRVVNEYREMLGCRWCFIEPRLCRAALKHSRFCDKLGRIGHEGLGDGTPQSRVKAEGFEGQSGENVARGYSSPADFWWKGWYTGSDHHRNGARVQWNCVGYGQSGITATELFSTLDAPEGMKEPS